jgi:alcohol dehydrogenase YqhD (iron-dependent ADH family)
MAEGLLRTAKECVFAVLKNPEDYRNRAQIMWAGSLAHNGLTGCGRVGDWATHQIGHELSALFDATHGAALAAIRIVMNEPERVTRLQHNVAFFLEQLHGLGIHARTESAIVPIVVGNSARALAAAKRLREAGIFVSPIRYPSVPENAARLRLTVMASHKESELIFCAEALAEAVSVDFCRLT